MKNLENTNNYTKFVVELFKLNSMRLKNETTTQVVHPDTGELITQTVSKTFTVKTTSDQFYFQFFSLMQNWIGLSNTAKNILAVLCTKSVYNTNRVSLTKHVRDEICEMCSIKPQSLANTLQELKRKEIITIDRGECYISYNYFWKGDLKTREQLLRSGSMTVNIEFERE